VGAFNRNRTYEEFKALDNVSFEVKKGDFIGIIGHNGSGKSTLLKCLASVYQVDKGKIDIDGQISPFLELGIGFNDELSGRDNIYLNATILGLTRKEINAKFDDIVAFAELERFIDQKVKNYSSGMKGRLAFSVSIHANRDILLMDEVLAVGDARFQEKCFNVFKKYKQENRTVILVTHDMGAVRDYCDSAILLHHGKIVMSGDVDKVCDEYILKNLTTDQRLALEKREKAEKLEKARKKEVEQKQEIGKQRKDELKVVSEKLDEDKKAKIIKVEFLNSGSVICDSFGAGDNILVRVYFKVFDIEQNINFGFGLYDMSKDAYLFGISTITDNFPTKESVKKGYFQISLKNVNLHGGQYYIKASIVDDDFSTASVLDVMEESDSFEIISNDTSEGFVNFDYTWE
jgi:ABC-type polysaccharide/polyol phosphate transport system ATPase subunit